MTSGDSGKTGRRAPPAFQMYAADRLADRFFKAMGAAERGLLHTIELELWVNGSVPADTGDMARALGMERAEVEEAFSGRVQRFLERRDVPERVWVSPDLEAYRQRLEARHEKQAGGGREGASRRWGNKGGNGLPTGSLDGQPIDYPNGCLSTAEQSKEEQSRKPPVSNTGLEQDPFVRGLEGPSPFEEEARRSHGAR